MTKQLTRVLLLVSAEVTLSMCISGVTTTKASSGITSRDNVRAIRLAANEPAQAASEVSTAQRFEAAIKMESERARNSHTRPTGLQASVMEQLQSGHYVTDAAIIALINTWSAYEAPSLEHQKVPAAKQFANTIQLINAVQPYTYGRPLLSAQLHQIMAELLRDTGDNKAASQEYQNSLDLLTPLHLSVDQSRMTSLVENGETLYDSGLPRQAETVFLEALSYDWYKVEDSETQQNLKSLYIRAGRGLIDCRRHNLAALKEIYFVPATNDVLQPYLDKAIKDETERDKGQ